MRAVFALLITSCAASCGSQASVPSNAGRALPAGATLVLQSEGLGVTGTGAGAGQEIGFGRFQPGAVAAAARVLGRDPLSPVQRTGCVGGRLTAVSWPRDGLTMFFDRGDFVGWQAGEGQTFTGPLQASGRICA